MIRFSVAVPVIRAVFQVDVVQRSGLLPIDILVLVSVGEGKDSPDVIAKEFGLSARLLDTTIVRLVEEDLLLLDMDAGRLAFTKRSALAWREGQLDQLAFRGEVRRKTFYMLQDLAWGGVVPFHIQQPALRLANEPPPGSIRIPVTDQTESLLSLHSARIAALFNSQPWLTRRAGKKLLALTGRLVGSPSSTNLIVDFRASGPRESAETWPVEPSSAMSPVSLRILQSRMRQWLQANPDKWNETLLEGEVVPAGSPDRPLTPLTEFDPLAEWSVLDPSAAMPTDANPRAVALQSHCQRLRDSQVHVDLVRDGEHVATCQRMIRDAKDYCVVHSAFWSENGIAQHEQVICEAIERGVNIYLLRGLGDEDSSPVPPPVVEKMKARCAGYQGRLFHSTIPHRSHAKFVVADGRSALISSFNFLGAGHDNPQLNVGLLADAGPGPDLSPGTAVIRDVLQYAAPEAPEGLSEVLEHEVSSRELMQAGQPSGMVSPAMGTWQDAKRWFESLQASNEVIFPWQIVTNENHRDALLISLVTAQRSLFVTSGDLSASAADIAFRSYLQGALKRGVAVTLLWGSQARDQQERDVAAALANRLAEECSALGPFRMNRTAKPIHAKMLVIDDWVSLVSSYNFLSYRGTRSGAHELGLKLYSHSVASQLTQIIEACVVDGPQR